MDHGGGMCFTGICDSHNACILNTQVSKAEGDGHFQRKQIG